MFSAVSVSGKLRNFVLVALPIAFALSIAPVGAAARGCISGSNPADSAINQYCETIPTSGGPQSAHGSAPSLSSTLPPKIIHEISGSGASSSADTEAPEGRSSLTASRRAARSGRIARTGRVTETAARDRRLLLTLPAADRAARATSTRLSAAATSVWSPYSGLLIALVTIILALAGTAFALGRRRQEPGD
jgi:hypothetical protein